MLRIALDARALLVALLWSEDHPVLRYFNRQGATLELEICLADFVLDELDVLLTEVAERGLDVDQAGEPIRPILEAHALVLPGDRVASWVEPKGDDDAFCVFARGSGCHLALTGSRHRLVQSFCGDDLPLTGVGEDHLWELLSRPFRVLNKPASELKAELERSEARLEALAQEAEEDVLRTPGGVPRVASDRPPKLKAAQLRVAILMLEIQRREEAATLREDP